MAKPQTSLDDLLTTLEAGVELGISGARVNVLIAEGRLPARKMGKTWIIRRADLELVRNRPVGVHRTDWREKTKRSKLDEKKKKS